MKLSKLFVIGIFFAVLIRLYVFSVSNNHLPVSSDESITVLQATQIAKGDLNLLFLGQPYGFPIESYLETLFINILPRTPFGVRIVDCLLGFVSLIIIFLIYRSIAPFENYWLGLLLFLFPSSYWLIIQYAYFLPFYTSSIDLWLFTLLLSLWAKKKSPLLLVAGFCYGLAFSVHILSVSIIVMAVPYCCLGENFKKTLKNIIIFFPALVVGLLPFLIAKWKFANAYNAVIQFREPLEALKALWDFVFINTLPRVFGITPPLFPDSKDIYDVFSKLSLIVSISYFLLLLSASGLKIFHFLKKLKRDKWPSLDINDVFIGASWVSIILFVLNTRSSFKDCRYLLPCLLSFPFVLSYLFANVNKVLKIVLGVGSIGLIMINIFSIFVLMHQWQRADFLDKHNLPDLKPVVDFLEDKKINRCYSTYRYSYRIMFLTDQKIVCSQRFNERFLGWPIPYKETVDSAKNVAYVLNPKARFLKPAEFEKDLTAMDVSCKRETINDFIVYYDFFRTDAINSKLVPRQAVKIDASAKPDQSFVMNDGRYTGGFWSTHPSYESEKMWIRLDLEHSFKVKEILIHYRRISEAMMPYLNVEVLTKDGFKQVISSQKGKSVPFQFINDHPVYHFIPHKVRSFRLPEAIETDTIKIEMDKPVENSYCEIAEIEIKYQ